MISLKCKTSVHQRTPRKERNVSHKLEGDIYNTYSEQKSHFPNRRVCVCVCVCKTMNQQKDNDRKSAKFVKIIAQTRKHK